MHKSLIMVSAAALAAVLLAGPSARAQQANYSLPAEPTAKAGAINYYAVPLGYTWDMFSYETNGGDWNIGDHGFDAGEIPMNPQFCGANGDMCPATAGAMGNSFITINADPTHGFTNIPILIGPTQDGFNNVQIGNGQAVPVVPGKYTAAFVTYAGVNGPHHKMVSLNYTDTSQPTVFTWADWCAPQQAPPDFATWKFTHRLGANEVNSAACGLITKYVRVDPNRTLTSITIGEDSAGAGGQSLPGDTLTGSAHRLVVGSVTLASTDATLGGYGFVSGQIKDASGTVQKTDDHAGTGGAGFDVFVMDPALGHYGAGANVDGSYTLGLPAGTYTLSAAVRGGSANPTSAGPQATPISVTVTAGKTTTQDITMLASPTPNLWGEVMGTVKDASGNPVAGAAILTSSSATGPFAAVAIPQDFAAENTGETLADGTFDIQGLDASKDLYLEAVGNGFASASPVKVTLKGGGIVMQDIATVVVKVGNITGTLVTPEGNFGGIGIPVTLTSMNLTQTATTIALPALNGTGRVPETGETATFEFDNLPVGDYMLTLPASAVQGAAAATPVTIVAGQTASPVLKLTFPAWTEGTPDAKIGDPLTGTALDAKWTTADIGTSAAGSNKEDSTGLTVMADGTGWDADRVDDAFNYVYQPISASGDWVAYVTVTAVPTAGTTASNNTSIVPGGEAGLKVSSPSTAADGKSLSIYAANFTIADTNGEGVVSQGRLADGATTFPYSENAAGTDAANGGTQPALPVTLKIRKTGASFAGFYSTDNGATQHFIGLLTPQFDLTTANAKLLLGLATTSNTDGTLDTATYKNFVFAPFAAPPPAAGP